MKKALQQWRAFERNLIALTLHSEIEMFIK